jgi:TRAP-type C4-dicarboxylate transport system substrate-binding protein
VTLRLGLDGADWHVVGGEAAEFARQVEERSGGELHVEPQYGFTPEEQIVDQVVDGELQLALIAARHWDTEGVQTMRALHAPFLVTSDELMDLIVTNDALAGEMLAGLEPLELTGLALLPDGLRHVFSFGEPLLTPSDFAGTTIRALPSESTYAVLEALGARPELVEVTAENTADGTVGAVEGSFAIVMANTFPAQTTVVGNVTLFPRINSLIVNTEVFDDLSEDQQDVLRSAAIATRDWAVDNNVDDAEFTEDYCNTGGTVVLADEAQLEAFRAATAPVYDELQQDEATAAMIQRIDELAEDVPPAVEMAPCVAAVASPATSSPLATPDTSAPATIPEPIVLDGEYRWIRTEQDLLDAGIPPNDAAGMGATHGVQKMTMHDGVFSFTTDDVPPGPGTYEIEGSRVTFRWTEPGPGEIPGQGDWSATATIDGDQVLWSDVTALPPFDSPADLALVEEVFGTVPWTRIGDVGTTELTAATTSVDYS